MRFFHLLRAGLFSLLEKKTIGVRMLLLDEDKVLLVKHTYQTGWYTIGGGVESGETPQQAMTRELKEEVGATLTTPLRLFSVYHSRNEQRDDYIVFYTGHGSLVQTPTVSDEIAEQQWFPLDALPDDVSPATRRRILEYLGKAALSETW